MTKNNSCNGLLNAGMVAANWHAACNHAIAAQSSLERDKSHTFPAMKPRHNVASLFPRIKGRRCQRIQPGRFSLKVAKKMPFVYSRVGAVNASGFVRDADSGWLRGAGARGLPYRRAWIANGGHACDLWPDMAFAPSTVPRLPGAARTGQGAYILQQDPSGLWFVDPWGNNNAGTIRPASHSAGVAGGRDLNDTCFIIELDHATCL
jgi:hypothetical protein